MDAVRYEQATGILLSKRGHFQKLLDRRTQLLRMLHDKGMVAGDRAIVKELLVDIQMALSGF